MRVSCCWSYRASSVGCEALPVEVGHDAHAVLVVAVLGSQVARLHGLPHVVVEERQEARPAHQRFLLEDDNDGTNDGYRVSRS